jgi:amidase
MTTALPFQTAKQLAAAIRKKKIGCLELLDLYLKRVETYNPALNAIIATDIEGARKRAKAADRAVKAGKKLGPLHGVPMTVKESFNVEGYKTTWGIPALKDNTSKTTASLPQRMLDAGVTLFGKTNVPIRLGDYQSYNDIYGTTNNPWDSSRGPGGSSGGSAAALAAGLTGIEAGSDIGSSLRNPAHFCGVFSHKPTWGVVSTKGHTPAEGSAHQAIDIAVVGPLARGAEDLEIAMDAIAGPDAIDARGWKLALPRSKKKSLREFKVAVVLSDANAEVDQAVQDEIQKLADFLGKKKAKVSTTARPAFDTTDMHEVFFKLLNAALSGRMSDEEYAERRTAADRFAPADTSTLAHIVRGFALSHRDWLQLNERRHRMRLAWEAFFGEYDVMLAPVTATAAFPHDHEPDQTKRHIIVNNKKANMFDQMFWAGYCGVTLMPASTAPIGQTKEGLPVGVQIIGPQYGDYTCIKFAELLEKDYRAFVPPPGFE